MAKFRKQIKSNFTTVHNDFIDDLRLGNDTIGLLLKMVKLPDDWNFSIKGLAAISKDGERKISRQLKELEEFGYLVRRRIQSTDGKFADWEYIISDEQLPDEILELSNKNSKNNSGNSEGNNTNDVNTSSSPHRRFADVVNADVVNVDVYKIKNNKIKNNILYQSYQSNNLSNKEYMANSDILESFNKETDVIDKNKSEETVENREQISTDSIKAQLNYDTLISEHSDKAKHIDSLVNLIADIMQTKLPHIRIAKECYPRSDVVQRFEQLTDKHILYVIDCLVDTKPKSKNLKNYLLTALYNAPATYESYIASQKQYSFDIAEFKALANRFDT